MMPKPEYDTTLARIAGNVAAGCVSRATEEWGRRDVAEYAVAVARHIVAEIKRTEPQPAASKP